MCALIIHKILHEVLGLEKKTARWMPRLFSEIKKKNKSLSAAYSSLLSSATPWKWTEL
jgi:hypothetical protein